MLHTHTHTHTNSTDSRDLIDRSNALVNASMRLLKKYEKKQTSLVTFTHGAGRAKVRDGYAVTYDGVIGAASFAYLRAMVIASTYGAPALLFDVSRMVDSSILVPSLPHGPQMYTMAPGAIVCREDQIEIWKAYAKRLAELGIMRVVFSSARFPVAVRIVDSMRCGHPHTLEKMQEAPWHEAPSFAVVHST